MSTYDEQRGERWLPVFGYEGKYDVSSFGNIRSLKIINGQCDKLRAEPKLMRLAPTSGGYPAFAACIEGKALTYHVHRAVALAFLGQPPIGKHLVAHKDGNPANNRVENLYWASYQENENDKARHCRNMPGSKNHQAKLDEEKVRHLRIVHGENPTMTCKKLGALFGISGTVANKIVRRVAWKHVA